MSKENTVEDFNAENFSIDQLDQPDGESSDVSIEALEEMGIIESSSSNSSEVKQSDNSELEKLGEDASIADVLKELSKNPKQFDEEIEKELADNDQPEEESIEEALESIMYNGEEKQLTKDEFKEYASKGFDYTQKTQDLSKQRLEFDKSVEAFEEQKANLHGEFQKEKTQFQNELGLKKQWDFALDTMQKQNPDLYDEVKSFHEELITTYNNPLIQDLMNEVQSLKSQGLQKEDANVANQYHSQMSKAKKDIFPMLEKLGLRVDEAKVKDAWIKGAENVESAVYSIYGDSVRKVQESRLKLSAARRKTSTSKSPTMGNTNASKTVEKSSKPKSYHDISKKFLRYS